jgi:phospholipase C
MSEIDTFLVNRLPNDTYSLWSFSAAMPDLVQYVPTPSPPSFPYTAQLVPIGAYVLAVSPLEDVPLGDVELFYRLSTFDPLDPDPLDASTVQTGVWPYEKFWDYYAYHDCPGGPQTTDLQFLPTTGNVLQWLPTTNRGTFALWSFDAANPDEGDPLCDRLFDQDAHPVLRADDILLPIQTYVFTWNPTAQTWSLYSFDPQSANPMPLPALGSGSLAPLGIDASHQLVVVGDFVLDWVPSTRAYRLWAFQADGACPLAAIVREGTLPAGFTPESRLTGIQRIRPIDTEAAGTPGTMDFFRENIDHVVVYALESRSFDNVLGWLYANGTTGVNWVDAAPPFQGASTANTNSACGQTYAQSLYANGDVSPSISLNSPTIDPFHGTTDSICQQWSGGYAAYQGGQDADMAGFVANQGSADCMLSFSPQQMPVLNELAGAYAVCDAWFASLPGGTTANRAYLASGSAYGITVSYESGEAYADFPNRVRRNSMYKVLVDNGITDWAIYSTVEWQGFPYTYHLFVANQVPSIDANAATFAKSLDDFRTDVLDGTLPAFSFVEPKWFASDGVFSSYHPSGDIVPGQQQLGYLFELLKSGPSWDRTALVITFSKGGGMYDHIATPRATKAWPHDTNDGFDFDAYGARVPAIVVSPRIPAHTVFRSPTEIPFDHTSIIATVLDWFGVPRARWGLGERVATAPTFERVFTAATVRTDAPTLATAIDSAYPQGLPLTWPIVVYPTSSTPDDTP